MSEALDLLRMIQAATPFAVGFMMVFGGGLWLIVKRFWGRQASLLLYLICALYVGYLMHGTVVSRMSCWKELFEWEITAWSGCAFLRDTDRTWILHALFNVALFVPWGFLGMCGQKRIRYTFPVFASGILMSAAIECFQGFHGMIFDLGDLMSNSIGTAVGCLAGVPVTLFNGRREEAESARNM